MDSGDVSKIELSKAPANKLPGLDLLRAIAILWIIVYHAGKLGFIPNQGGWIFISCGWISVDIFFALSGYLIGKQLLSPWRHGSTPDYARFFRRRFFRTLPAYFFVLVLYFNFPVTQGGRILEPLWHYLTFSMNFFRDASQMPVFSHAWSLCVEEQFYLFCPIVIACLAKKPSVKKIVFFVGMSFFLGIAIRGYIWLRFVADPPFSLSTAQKVGAYKDLIYVKTWNRLDELLIGVALASVQLFRPGWWRKACARPNLLLAAGLCGMFSAAWMFSGDHSVFFGMFVFPVLAISLGLLVMSGTQDRSFLTRLALPGTASLAAGSYSLYLIHPMVYNVILINIDYLDGLLDWVKFGVVFVVALFFGALLHMCVERPFLKLRDRIDRWGT